jgi:hypothetical protein
MIAEHRPKRKSQEFSRYRREGLKRGRKTAHASVDQFECRPGSRCYNIRLGADVLLKEDRYVTISFRIPTPRGCFGYAVPGDRPGVLHVFKSSGHVCGWDRVFRISLANWYDPQVLSSDAPILHFHDHDVRAANQEYFMGGVEHNHCSSVPCPINK